MGQETARFEVSLLPGALRAADEHRRAGQQQDDLCACYWAAILLRTDGWAVDAEAVAVAAGARLPGGDPADSVPPGTESRRDYRARLPVAERPDAGGTSVAGLIEAVAGLSEGYRSLVPLRTSWTAERVGAALDLCRANPTWEAVPIANVRTGPLWGSRLPLADALAWLSGREILPPSPDWDVGHFVAIAGTWEGQTRSLVIVRDSYPRFGWDAHHLQPPQAVAAALARGDGRQGGVALYVASDVQADVERAAKDAGFEIAAWDNGTPWSG